MRALKHFAIFLVSILFLLAFPLFSSTFSQGNVPLLSSTAFADTSWGVIPNQNPPQQNGANFWSTAAISANDVWAAGFYNGNNGYRTLTEHWNGTSWTVKSSPNPTTSTNQLMGIAAVSANDVWAVGSYYDTTIGHQQTLILHWVYDTSSGSYKWKQISSPNASSYDNTLLSVAAVSANNVWAVGNYTVSSDGGYSFSSHTLVEHWDGTSWSVVTSPSGGSWLTSVTAVSSSDVWAVGGTSNQAFAMHWDGSSWSVVSTPTVSQSWFNSVTAISSSDIWAVGAYTTSYASAYSSLAMHWDGSSWSVVNSPNPTTYTILYGVTKVSSSDIWAVGFSEDATPTVHTTAMHWDGNSWSTVATPANAGSYFWGTAAVGTNDVWAVGQGSSGALTEHYAPTSYSISGTVYNDSNKNGAQDSDETGYSGATLTLDSGPTTTTDANGTFAFSNLPAGTHTVTLTLPTGYTATTTNPVSGSLSTNTTENFGMVSNTGWGVVSSPNNSTYNSHLESVATVSATDVWAVGSDAGTGNYYHNLTEHWDGTSWTVKSSPNIGSSSNQLHGVAAVAANDVWAVGSYTSPTLTNPYYGYNVMQTLILHWDGTSWSAVTSPNATSYDNSLSAITVVSANDIWAVGQYTSSVDQSSGSSNSQPLIEHWDGTSWSVVSSPAVSQSWLTGVTAVSANDVWAVGGKNSLDNLTLTEHWDGTSWSVVSSPNVCTGSYCTQSLTGVSAASSGDVWAVGIYHTWYTGTYTTMTMHWDGDSWNMVSSPNVPNYQATFMLGVKAVSSGDVWAVGYAQDNTLGDQAVAMHWDGNGWNFVTTQPNTTSIFMGIAAVNAGDIWAVGSGYSGTLAEHYPTRISGKTPLILIPGVMGSKFAVAGSINNITRQVLANPLDLSGSCTTTSLLPAWSYSSNELLWIDENVSDWFNTTQDKIVPCANFLDVLQLQHDGQTNMYPVSLNDQITDHPYNNDTIPYLTQHAGYRLNQDLFIYPYDWRKDLSANVAGLDALINSATASAATTQVDILAHSMGGLVARKYISDATRAQKVHTLVELGTPHVGTSTFLAHLLYNKAAIQYEIPDNIPVIGSKNIHIVNGQEVNKLVQNFPGAFELLPSKQYYHLYHDNPKYYPYSEDGILDNNTTPTGPGPLDYDQLKTLLLSDLPQFNKNSTVYNIAEGFHDTLDPTYSSTSSANIYMIAGSGFSTIGQIHDYTVHNILGLPVEEQDADMFDGDGTVATRSATLSSLDTPQDNIFYAKQEHGPLMTSDALTMATLLLGGHTAIPSGLNIRKTPYGIPNGGETMSIYSPAVLDVYDDQNNHTGPKSDGTFEENIPGSMYYEVGESKSIYLPPGGHYTITTKATAAGSFSLRWRTYQNSVVSQEQLFYNVPQTASTSASMDLNATTPVLSVDVNGDGSNVQQVSPVTLTGDAVSDFAPPFTTASLSPAPNADGNYSDPTTATLTASASAGFSVANTYYTIDGGSQQTYSSPFTVSGSGSHTITYWSVDNEGLTESANTKTFTIATPITLRSSASANNGSGGTTLTLNTPTGTSNGDVMVAHVVVQTAGNSIAAPSGWAIIKRLDTTTNIATATYWKVAGSSEPSSYTWTFGTSGEASGGIASYTGVNTTNPIDVSMVQYNNGTTNVDNTGVTTTFANEMLVYAVGIVSASPTLTVPSGFTQEWKTSSTSNTTSEMSQKIASSAGSTGTIHGTLSSTYSTVTHLIALRPASATPPTPPSGISLRSSSAGNNGSGSTTLVITKPTGTTTGDVMVAEVTVHTAGNSIAAPSGWNLVLRQDTGTALSTASYIKVATSSEPSSYTWTFGTSGEASGGIGSYIGVDTTTPVDARHAQYNNGVSNVDNAGVTTIAANDMLVYAVGIIIPTAFTLPSGFTDEWYAATNSQTTSEMSQKIDSSTGATGNIHGSLPTGTYSSVTHLIALRPANAPTPTPPAGISLRSQAANNNGGGSSSLTLNVPQGTTSGDVMVAHVAVRTAGNTITAPSGWTQIVRKDTGSALSTVAYWKVAGSSEPSSYTWSFGTSGEASGGIGSYIGVNTTTPIDVSNGQYNSATNNVDNTGVTTTAANDMLVYAVGVVQSTTVNPPSGFTEETYTASNSLTTSEMSQEIDSSTGATGTIHGTENGGETFSNVTLLIALKAQ